MNLDTYVYSKHFLTWTPFHIGHKRGRLLWCGLLQCVVACACNISPFHKHCKGPFSLDHFLQICHFGWTLTWSVHPDPKDLHQLCMPGHLVYQKILLKAGFQSLNLARSLDYFLSLEGFYCCVGHIWQVLFRLHQLQWDPPVSILQPKQEMSPGFLGRHLPLHGRGSPQSPPDLLTLGLSYKEEDGNACSFSGGPWRMGWMTPRLFYELRSGDHLHRPRSHRWNLCPPLTLWTRRWYFPWSRSIGDKAFLLKTSSMRNTRSVVTIRWCAFSRPHICHLHSYDVGVKFSSKCKKNQKECVILREFVITLFCREAILSRIYTLLGVKSQASKYIGVKRIDKYEVWPLGIIRKNPIRTRRRELLMWCDPYLWPKWLPALRGGWLMLLFAQTFTRLPTFHSFQSIVLHCFLQWSSFAAIWLGDCNIAACKLVSTDMILDFIKAVLELRSFCRWCLCFWDREAFGRKSDQSSRVKDVSGGGWPPSPPISFEGRTARLASAPVPPF